MITLHCQQCSAPFQTYPSMSHLKYCSTSCYHATKGGTTIINCEVCEKPVKSYLRKLRRYCGKSCARTALNRTSANPSFHRDISGSNNPMFGKVRTGADNPMFGRRKHQAPQWKGGRKLRKDGYILVVAPDDHPYPADSHTTGLKYILEHRLIMEQHLGRYLLPTEVVHHIDENPSNNALDNLMLFASQREHIKYHSQHPR